MDFEWTGARIAYERIGRYIRRNLRAILQQFFTVSALPADNHDGWGEGTLNIGTDMKISRILCGALVLLASIATAALGAAPRRLDLADVAAIVRVSEPQLSPDGKSIVFVVARPNIKEARYDKSLVLVDVSSGQQRVLTYDRKGVSAPRWSPSGESIAFLDNAVPTEPAAPEPSAPEKPPAAGTPRSQIFVMPMNGGDAHRITNSSRDVEQFAWSPDGTQIAYAVADQNPNQKEIDRHNDAFQVGDNDYLATEAAMPSHLWLAPASGGAARRLTSGSWSLPKGAPPSSPASPLSWSNDGRSIAIVQQSTPNWGDSDQSVVAIVDVASGQIRKLTAHQALEGYPVYSPDNTRIAYWYSRDGDPNNENELLVAPSSGGNGVDLTRALDRSIVRAEWSGDGKSLLVGAHDGVRSALWLLPLSGPAQRIDLGNVDPAWSYWVDLSLGKDGALAFAGNTPTHPNEIYYLAPGAQPRRLTSFNQEAASRELGRAEEFDWKGPNGYQENGVVVYPPGFDSHRKYPLVLVIHGGPQSASTLAFSPLAQLLAAHDYLVFSPNYRGSDNLGNAYERAIFNDAGAGPGRDVIAGIEALEQKGFVDKSRIAVSGWSYGGYMTSWLIGHYHIWKAAVSGAAVNDLLHEYALSDDNVTERYNFGGPPWSDKMLKAYQEQSPISFASHITTPTLILSDTGDARVPITESYLMYHALKDRNVPVEFIAYPVSGHFPGDPVRGPDVDRRWVEWIDRHLRSP
jgi:dipeptidyl aminopeptidase/acylaminoacyl peptidase